MIVDNVAGLAGGGISLQDAVQVSIQNNTIANNDSLATAGEAFAARNALSSRRRSRRGHRVPGPATRCAWRSRNRSLRTPLRQPGARQQHHLAEPPVLLHGRRRALPAARPCYGASAPTSRPSTATASAAPDAPVFCDLGVIGPTARATTGPRNCILDSLTEDGRRLPPSNHERPGSSSRVLQRRAARACTQPEVTTAIQAPPAFDEGGNFIKPRFGPLTSTRSSDPTRVMPYGNYHVTLSSPAISAGLGAQRALATRDRPRTAPRPPTTTATPGHVGAGRTSAPTSASSPAERARDPAVQGLFGAIADEARSDDDDGRPNSTTAREPRRGDPAGVLTDLEGERPWKDSRLSRKLMLLVAAARARGRAGFGSGQHSCPCDARRRRREDTAHGSPSGRDPWPARRVKCKHLTGGDGFVSDGRRHAAVHLRLLRRDRRPGGRRSMDRRAARRQLPGADHRGRRGRQVLPDPDQRRHGHPARPLRPALRPLPRLPAAPRRSSTALPESSASPSTWARPSPTSTSWSSPAPTCTTATSRRPSTCRWACSATSTCSRPSGQNADRPATRRRDAPGTSTRPCTAVTPTTTGTARPATTSSSRSRSARFDPDFHDASESVQPLPFAVMRDRYPMLNGRGYPDTRRPGLPTPLDETGDREHGREPAARSPSAR